MTVKQRMKGIKSEFTIDQPFKILLSDARPENPYICLLRILTTRILKAFQIYPR